MHINVAPNLLNFSEVILWHQIQKHWSEKLTTCANKEAGKSHHEYILKCNFHTWIAQWPLLKSTWVLQHSCSPPKVCHRKSFIEFPTAICEIWVVQQTTPSTWKVVGKVFGSIVQKLVSFFFEILPYPTAMTMFYKVVSPLTTEPLLSWLLTKFIYNS